MKLVVWENYLGGQILYKSLVPSKKRRQCHIFVQQFTKIECSHIFPFLGFQKIWRSTIRKNIYGTKYCTVVWILLKNGVQIFTFLRPWESGHVFKTVNEGYRRNKLFQSAYSLMLNATYIEIIKIYFNI